MLRNNLFPHAPRIKQSTIVFDAFFKIRCDSFVASDTEKEYNYYSLETHSPAVVILAQTQENMFLLVEELRHSVRNVLLSCPGGYLDAKEKPEIGAARELKEETGYVANRLVHLGSAYPYPGISSQKLHYVAALGAKKECEPQHEPMEILRPVFLSRAEIQQRIAQGEAVDGNLCTALFFWDLYQKNSN